MKIIAFWLLCGAHAWASSAWIATDKLTPGLVGHHSLAQVCQANFSATIRKTTPAMKEQVYREYGIRHHRPGQFEVDHRIPLSLDGADDVLNLSAQSYTGRWNAHVKDALEVRIHALVCHEHKLSLAAGQGIFFGDWTTAFLTYFPKGQTTK